MMAMILSEKCARIKWMNLFFLTQFRRLIVAGTVIILLVGSAFFYYKYRTIKNSIAGNLEHAISVSIAAIDPASLEKLVAGPADLESVDYQRLRNQLAILENVYRDDGIRGFYAMRINEGQISFLVDSAPVDDSWHSEPGVIYEAPPAALVEVAGAGQGRLVGPYTDEYGSYYSYFEPIKNPDGKIVAVMGIDTEVTFFRGLLWDSLKLPFIILILILPLYVVTILSLSRKMQAIYFRKQKEDLEHGVQIETQELNDYIKKLDDKAAELEHFKKLTASRDIEIAELKQQIKTLKK
jgi:hypothetical protein